MRSCLYFTTPIFFLPIWQFHYNFYYNYLAHILPQTTTTNHYHNWGVNIYYHTNFCSNPTIFQFYHTFYHTCYHKFYHKPLPLSPPTPPWCFLYLRETHTNVLRGLQIFVLHPIRPLPWKKISSKIVFLTPFWSPFKNWRPDPKACGQRSWLPISKMVWHFTIGSVVWMLELSKVGCKDLASSENKYKNKLKPPFKNQKPDLKVCGERTWLPIYKWCDTWQSVQQFGC